MYQEPRVTVNGVLLTFAQTMTLRVAVSSFLSDLDANGLGDDDMGKTLTEGYIHNGREVEHLLLGVT